MKEDIEYKEGRTIKDIDFNQRQLIDVLNHRMTKVEESVTSMEVTVTKISSDMKWMKGVGYYMAGIVTALATKLMFL